jgi:hypothetical protein
MCFSFESLQLTVLEYVSRAAYVLEDKYNVLVTA